MLMIVDLVVVVDMFGMVDMLVVGQGVMMCQKVGGVGVLGVLGLFGCLLLCLLMMIGGVVLVVVIVVVMLWSCVLDYCVLYSNVFDSDGGVIIVVL